MAAGIDEICNQAAALVAAAVPDIEPQVRFREASYEAELLLLPAKASPREHTRAFQVRPLEPEGYDLQGSCFRVVEGVAVAVRYDVQLWDDRQRLRRLERLVRTDQARIAKALLRAPMSATWPLGHFCAIAHAQAGTIEQSEKTPSIFVATTIFRVVFELKD